MKSEKQLVYEQKKMRSKYPQTKDSWRTLPILETRLAKVPSEQLVVMKLKSLNAKVYRGGWPDFLTIKEGKPTLIEVKSGSSKLSPSQVKMHKALRVLGLTVTVLNTDEKDWQTQLDAALGA
jgi:hypothetical protein